MSMPASGFGPNVQGGISPEALAQPGTVDRSNPHVIASQLEAYAQSLGSAGYKAPPPPPLPGVQPQPPVQQQAAPVEPVASVQQQAPPTEEGFTTIADLATVFEGTDGQPVGPEVILQTVRHKIGDQDYSLQEIFDGFAAQPAAAQVAAQRASLTAEFGHRAETQDNIHNTAMEQLAGLKIQLETQLKADEDPLRLAELARTNPVAYQAKVVEIQGRRASAAAAETELTSQKDASARALEQRHNEFRSQEAVLLGQKFPEWGDAEKGPQLRNAIHDYAREIGFTDQDLSVVEDHKVLLVLRDAALGQQVRKNGGVAIRAAKDRKLPAPTPQQIARGELPGRDELATTGRADAFKKLTRDHSLDSAADVFASLTG